MKKILVVAALVVGLCLSTAVANGAVWTDTDTVTFTGNTGFASLKVQNVSFHFKDLQPGERLATYWWIKNDGPCPLRITVTHTVTGNPAPWIVPVFHPGYTLFLGPGIRKQVALTVYMQTYAPDSTAGRNFTVKVTFTSKENSNYQAPIPWTGNY